MCDFAESSYVVAFSLFLAGTELRKRIPAAVYLARSTSYYCLRDAPLYYHIPHFVHTYDMAALVSHSPHSVSIHLVLPINAS